MVGAVSRLDGFARARYLRGAAHVATTLWVIGWLVFAILVGVRADTELVSAVGALICLTFATSFGLHVAARRVAMRELNERLLRDDLIASRSRGRRRIRERQSN
jgi:hypothetical protein